MSGGFDRDMLAMVGGTAAAAIFVFRYLRDALPAGRKDIARVHERLDALVAEQAEMRTTLAYIRGRVEAWSDN